MFACLVELVHGRVDPALLGYFDRCPLVEAWRRQMRNRMTPTCITHASWPEKVGPSHVQPPMATHGSWVGAMEPRQHLHVWLS